MYMYMYMNMYQYMYLQWTFTHRYNACIYIHVHVCNLSCESILCSIIFCVFYIYVVLIGSGQQRSP